MKNNINVKTINLYSDGACSGNPGPGGWACINVLNQKNVRIISGYENQTTNNRMEMIGAINGINNIKDISNINLFTDSIYLKKGITEWIINWKKNNWMNSSKKTIANKDLWLKLDQLTGNSNINWHWIKGHSNDKYNDLADYYAVKAMKEKKGINHEISL